MALKPLNSVGGFSVGEIPANVILANADIISNNLTVQKVANLGPVGNVIITGGSANQYLQTDGAGNLTWTTADTSRILNGTSNVSIPTVNGNVNTSVGGVANVFVVTTSGANVTGTFDASGNLTALNANLGNLVSANFANFANDVVVQGNIANANNISVTNNVNAVVGNFSGNINSLNANLGNLAQANYVNVTQQINGNTANFSGNVEANGVKTDNLYHANGQPWDFQQPAGANTQVQYNDGAGGFGANANFTFNDATNVLTVAGNANLTVVNTSNVNSANSLYLTANGFTLSLYANGLAEFEDGILSTGNLTVGNANLGNLATAAFINASSNVNVTGTMQAGNVRTDNLLYANGNPWDLQEAAGANTEIQYNMGDDFAASANFTYNDATQQFTVNGNANIASTLKTNTEQLTSLLSTHVVYGNGSSYLVGSANFTFNDATNVLTVNGNANVTNTLLTPNVNSGSGNLALTSNGKSTVYDTSGNVTFPAGGTVTAGTFVGNVQANITITAANTTVLFSDNGLVDGSTGFTFNKTSNLVTMTGNLRLGPAGYNNINNNSNAALEIQGGWNQASGSGVNIVAGDYSNNSNWGKLSIQGNVSGNSVGFSEANAFVFTNPGYGLGNVVKVDILNPAATSTTTGVIQANGGIGVAGNGYFGGDLVVTGNIANANNISATNGLFSNTANITANLTSGNANLGNLAQANFVNVASNLHTVNANVTGTLEVANANIASNLTVNNLTVNLDLSGNTANFTGNVILSGANVTVNNHLSGNVANFSGNITSLNANLGNIADANYVRSSELYNGNSNIRIAPNGNITVSATGVGDVLTVSNVGANVTGYVTANGNGTFGALHSNTLTAQGGNLTIYAATGDNYVELRPTGNGHVDVGNFRIQSLQDPVNAQDAATKKYVDDVAQGLNIHDACYAATGNTLANLTGGTITYNNGTSGVGATLTLSGSPTKNFTDANTFDGNVTAVATNRILVKNEANAAHNGIYVVTSSTVLTRATDYNSVPEVEAGDFTFVTNGDTYNDTGWVQTSVVVTIGTDPIEFTQFSGAGTYTAGQGLTLTGTVFSVNVDNLTTEIAGGNVVVKANAQLTTPNIGAATGTSLNLTGNLLAGNVNSNAKVTAVDIEASGNIIAANISANSNLIVNNATVNLSLTGNTANFSGNVVVPNLTVNTALAGNTANFSGNIVALNTNAGNVLTANFADIAGNLVTSNLTVNTALSGNTANFSGNAVFNGANVTVGNLLLGNTANFSGNVVVPNLTVNLELAGNTANFSGNLVAANLVTSGTANVANLNVTANVTSALTPNANLTLDLGSSTQRWQDVYAGNIDASGNLTLGGDLSANNFSANTLTANTSIDVGNTQIYWGQVTTTSTGANQTISSVSITGVTGIEWIVKGVDSAGTKYSMAVVTAVTDGTSADYSTFGTVNLNGTTGSLAVNVSGSNIALQVTPSSSNSTVWVTQYRTL